MAPDGSSAPHVPGSRYRHLTESAWSFPQILQQKEHRMLRWALVFLVIALIAAVFGFWRLEGLAMWIAKVLFVVFLILFVISFVLGRRAPPAI
jgi:uncharacterized membrane protein YtjA (UPF0391 family)